MVNQTEQVNKLVTAKARNLHISPRKMRLVTNLVKNMRVADAVTQLQFANKKGAEMLIKLLQSAIANAENNFSINRDGLFIKTITTDMGPMLKRTKPRARGSAFIIRRKMSHVNVVLEDRAITKSKVATVAPKKAKKAEPVQTKEGAVGLPKEVETPITKGPTQASEIHRENSDKQKKQDMSSTRGHRTTNK